MPKYHCNGYKGVNAHDAREAAYIFANRMARRRYGDKGYCRTIRQDAFTHDGKSAHFEAVIGKGSSGIAQSIWLYVFSE
jgi:hypothetical protein